MGWSDPDFDSGLQTEQQINCTAQRGYRTHPAGQVTELDSRPLDTFMAYELYIYPPKGPTLTVTPQTVVAAFVSTGLPVTEQPDQFGHWLVLDGVESALDLTIKDGIVTGANFRFATEDDESVVQRVADVFKSLGFLVSDDEGEL